MKNTVRIIKRSLIQLESPYPDDDLIENYSDFIKFRDFLPYYRFNPSVFVKLVELTHAVWNASRRVNRLSMLQLLKRYGKEDLQKVEHIQKLSPLLFEIFRNTIEKKELLPEKQYEQLQQLAGNLLINIPLQEEEVKWLLDHALQNDFVLNRLLRYPEASSLISAWARNNYMNNALRNRRAELTSWIIDEDPDFEIEQQTLLDDFEHMNWLDKQSIKNFEEESRIGNRLEREFGGILFPDHWGDGFDELGFPKRPKAMMRKPEIKLVQRFYGIPTKSVENIPVRIPDFKNMKARFYADIDQKHKISMLWAIGYARLPEEEKIRLIAKYYNSRHFVSAHKIAKKFQLTGLLRWLLEQEGG